MTARPRPLQAMLISNPELKRNQRKAVTGNWWICSKNAVAYSVLSWKNAFAKVGKPLDMGGEGIVWIIDLLIYHHGEKLWISMVLTRTVAKSRSKGTTSRLSSMLLLFVLMLWWLKNVSTMLFSKTVLQFRCSDGKPWWSYFNWKRTTPRHVRCRTFVYPEMQLCTRGWKF